MSNMIRKSGAIIYWDSKENCYVAVTPLMIPCQAYGATPQKALEALEQDSAGFVEEVQEIKQPAPKPSVVTQVSTSQQPDRKPVGRERSEAEDPRRPSAKAEKVEQNEAVELVVSRENGNGFSIITVTGEIAHYSVNVFKEVFTAVVRDRKCHVVVDLAKATYADADTMGVWLDCVRTMHKIEKALVFANVPDFVERVVQILHIYQIFPRFSSVEDAVAGLSDPEKMTRATSELPY